jgi:hypothetical protein
VVGTIISKSCSDRKNGFCPERFGRPLTARMGVTLLIGRAYHTSATCAVVQRDQFESFAAQLQTSPLEGPAQVVVQGDAAQASLYEVQTDGTREQVFIPLVREPNGDWRIAPPSMTGCLP